MARAKRARGGGGATQERSLGARVLLGLFVVGAVGFAVEGGEYGTTDLLQQRTERQRLQHEVDSIGGVVRRLEASKKAVEGDPVVQERIAREEFGMVKGGKELLYRFTDRPVGDSAR